MCGKEVGGEWRESGIRRNGGWVVKCEVETHKIADGFMVMCEV